MKINNHWKNEKKKKKKKNKKYAESKNQFPKIFLNLKVQRGK